MSHASELKSIIPEEETKAYATWTRVPARFFLLLLYIRLLFHNCLSCSFFFLLRNRRGCCPLVLLIFFLKTTVIHTVETHETKKVRKKRKSRITNQHVAIAQTKGDNTFFWPYETPEPFVSCSSPSHLLLYRSIYYSLQSQIYNEINDLNVY